jgi:hypothetical protein
MKTGIGMLISSMPAALCFCSVQDGTKTCFARIASCIPSLSSFPFLSLWRLVVFLNAMSVLGRNANAKSLPVSFAHLTSLSRKEP